MWNWFEGPEERRWASVNARSGARNQPPVIGRIGIAAEEDDFFWFVHVVLGQTGKRLRWLNQRKFGRYFRVTKSWGEVRLEGGRKQRWCQLDVMSIRKWQERDVKAVVVKTAQVWRESKIAREMLCFTIETAAGGREGRRCRTGGCRLCSRYVRAMSARDCNGRRVQSSRKGKQCAAYYWGMQLQIARRLITVGARLRWVGMGAAVLLGNATADC